ncbi:MAG: YCF48-related protein [Myxococcota bacterium]
MVLKYPCISRLLAVAACTWRSPIFSELGGDQDTGTGDQAAALCGNFILDPQAGELCDDGNLSDGDGCSSECLIELENVTTLPNGAKMFTQSFAIGQGSVLYALAGGARGFRSTNQGTSWSECGSPGASVKQEDVSATPQDANHVYLATDVGVFESLDGCQTWQMTALGQSSVSLLVQSPTSVFVGTTSGIRHFDGSLWQPLATTLDGSYVTSFASDVTGQNLLAASRTLGIARTTDGGQNWSAANSGLSSLDVREVSLDANDAQRALASTAQGLFLSTNGGLVWNQASNIPGDSSAVDPADGSRVLYASLGGLYLSQDGGTSFGNVDLRSANMNNGQVWQVRFDPLDSQRLYVLSSRGLFTTTDKTTWNWTPAMSGITAWSVDALASGSGGEVFLGTPGGMLRSSDLGASWQVSADESVAAQVADVAVNRQNSAELFVVGFDAYLSPDNGATFNSIYLSITGEELLSGWISGSTIYLGTSTELIKSTDGGGIWSPRTVMGADRRVNAIWVDASETQVVLATDSGVFSAPAQSSTFTAHNTGLASLDTHEIIRLADGRFIVATSSGLYQSTDLAVAWSATGLVGEAVYDVLEYDAVLVAAAAQGLLYSRDAGTTWQLWPGVPVRRPRVLARHSDGRLLVGTTGYGLWWSDPLN